MRSLHSSSLTGADVPVLAGLVEDSANEETEGVMYLYTVSSVLDSVSVGSISQSSDGTGDALDAVAAIVSERLESDTAIAVDNGVVLEDIAALPFSMRSKSASPLKSGRNRVHQKTRRSPRSRMRCLRMNRMTRMKNMNAEIISTRSSQSDFSRAVMSCLDVPMIFVRVS